MAFVADASVALAWYFPDEATARSNALRERLVDEGPVVPMHWPLEVTNALLAAKRRGRIKAAEMRSIVADLRLLPEEVDGQTAESAWVAVLELAEKHSLTAYDAAYLELALRRRLPLATLDLGLAQAARESGVDLLV
jgi:predicted nucleic acid-binding protein